MTASLPQQTVAVKDASGIRKRRRRAPTGGASDDCFTCSKRGVKCDRRRPYCSQCLEVGNECSGYKTQLTWGVGVASRGKLRGLSLPIAKSPPVTREPKKSPARARAHSNASSNASNAARWMEQEETRRAVRAPIDIPTITHTVSSPATAYHMHGYDYLSMSHPDHPIHNHAHGGWNNMQYSPSGSYPSPDNSNKFAKFPMHIMTDGLTASMDHVGSEVDYMSPMSQSYPRDEMHFVHSPNLMYDSYNGTHHSSPAPHSPPGGLVIDHSRVPIACPGLVYTPSEHSSSLGSHMDPFDSHLGQKMMREISEHHMMPVSPYPF